MMPRGARPSSGAVDVTVIGTSNFYISRVERSRPTVSQFAVLSFLLQVLVSFVELKYQGKNFSSFEAHPVITLIAIASFFLYCFACIIDLRLTSDHRCAVLFGWLSAVSLASILHPDFSPLLFLLYVLFLAGVLLNLSPHGLWNWAQQSMRPNSIREQPIPDWNTGRGHAYPWINPEWSRELLNLRLEQVLRNWVHQRMGRTLINPNRNRIGRLPV